MGQRLRRCDVMVVVVVVVVVCDGVAPVVPWLGGLPR